MNRDLINNEFVALRDVNYFNCAYMGPFPMRTQQAVQQAVARWAKPSALDYSWVNYPDEVRSQVGQLLKCVAERVALNSSVGEAVSFYALGIQLPKIRVALFYDEYPSDVLPWMFAGRTRSEQMDIDYYDRKLLLDVSALSKKLHPKTNVMNFSHVGFQTGQRADLLAIGRLAHERELRLVVDVTQSLGGLELHPEELAAVDVLVCSPYKWLLSPYGQAISVWSGRALNEVRQTQGNWLTQPSAPEDLTKYSLESKPGARRFDRGQTPNILGVKGLSASLSLFCELGLAEIENHNLGLVELFLQQIDRRRYSLVTSGDLRSCIVCLRSLSGGSAEDLRSQLEREHIDVSVREGNLRVSFHLFNTQEQVERLVNVLNDLG